MKSPYSGLNIPTINVVFPEPWKPPPVYDPTLTIVDVFNHVLTAAQSLRPRLLSIRAHLGDTQLFLFVAGPALVAMELEGALLDILVRGRRVTVWNEAA